MARKNPDTKVSNTPSAKKERKILLCQHKYISYCTYISKTCHCWNCEASLQFQTEKKSSHTLQLPAINVYCAVLAFTCQPGINGPCGLNIFIQIIGTVPVYIICIIICVFE